MEKTLNLFNLKAQLMEEIENFTSSEIFELNNIFCIEANYHDDMIYELDDYTLDEIFHGQEPSQIIKQIAYGDFNYSHDFFRFDGYGNLESLSFLDVSSLPDFVGNIVDFIVENPSEFTSIFVDLEELLEIATANEKN